MNVLVLSHVPVVIDVDKCIVNNAIVKSERG
jgi:hypothetical protein